MITNEQLLQKATFSTSDFGGAGEAPVSVEQVTQFIELMASETVMLGDVRIVTSGSAKWQESIIDLGRVLKPGTEATRLDAADRVKPSTGVVEMSTVLVRAEIPVSDEVFEDNVAGDSLSNSIERLLAARAGFDVEDMFVNGDTGSGDALLALQDGWIKLAQGAGGHVTNASTLGQDYQEIFKKLLLSVPNRHKRNMADWRFYVPYVMTEIYRDQLSERGTAFGDQNLQGSLPLQYQGVKIVGVPSFDTTGNTSEILLANRNNLYAGFHRRMKFETYRDPREGATSFIVTCRLDAEIAVKDATAVATNVDVAV